MEVLSGDIATGSWLVSQGRINNAIKSETFTASTVLSMLNQGASKSRHWDAAAGGALVGGALFGALGAVAGGAVGGRNRDGSIISVEFRDGRRFLATCSHAEYVLLLTSITPKDYSRSLLDRWAFKNATPVTSPDGHQLLYGFIMDSPNKKRKPLQVRLWDHRLEWDIEIPAPKRRDPYKESLQLPLDAIVSLEATVNELGAHGVLVQTVDESVVFSCREYDARMCSRTWQRLLNETGELD